MAPVMILYMLPARFILIKRQVLISGHRHKACLYSLLMGLDRVLVPLQPDLYSTISWGITIHWRNGKYSGPFHYFLRPLLVYYFYLDLKKRQRLIHREARLIHRHSLE